MPKGTPDDPIELHPEVFRVLQSPEVSDELKENIRNDLVRLAQDQILRETQPKRDPFYSSKVCIARAKEHISEFNVKTVEWIKKNNRTPAFRGELDLKTLETIVYYRSEVPLPEDLPVILFDAVNNLRSALDQAIFSVTKRSWIAAFPIGRTLELAEDGIKRNCVDAPQEIIDIVRRTKPYKGGNNLLFALNLLCNTNKHEIVIPVATIPHTVTVDHPAAVPNIIIFDGVKNEVEVLRIPYPNTFQSIGKITLTASIMIRGIEFIDSQPAITVLDQFVDTVERIVMEIEGEAVRIGAV